MKDFSQKAGIVVLLLSTACGCWTRLCSCDNEDPSFAFFLENTFTANRIDTFNDKVTVDYWMSDAKTIRLCFTPDELDSIRQEMNQIEILNYPGEYKPPSGESREYWVDPHPVYYLKVRINGVVKEIHWNNSNLSRTEGAKKLVKLFDDIQRVLDKKTEYRRVPRKHRILM